MKNEKIARNSVGSFDNAGDNLARKTIDIIWKHDTRIVDVRL